MDLTPTPSQTVGPYLHLGLTDSRSVSCLTAGGIAGERVYLTCRVLDGDGLPVPDAMIELWQADADGNYNHPVFRGFGRMPTSEDGTCTFETIKPGSVSGPDGNPQAPHFNVAILGRGLLKSLSTRIYFAGEDANNSDPILALVPAARRHTLLAQKDSSRSGGWCLDVRLCGEDETVFFDV